MKHSFPHLLFLEIHFLSQNVYIIHTHTYIYIYHIYIHIYIYIYIYTYTYIYTYDPNSIYRYDKYYQFVSVERY